MKKYFIIILLLFSTAAFGSVQLSFSDPVGGFNKLYFAKPVVDAEEVSEGATVLLHLDSDYTDIASNTWQDYPNGMTGFTATESMFGGAVFKYIDDAIPESGFYTDDIATGADFGTDDFTIEFFTGYDLLFFSGTAREIYGRFGIFGSTTGYSHFWVYVNKLGTGFNPTYRLGVEYVDNYGTTTITGDESAAYKTGTAWWHVCFERQSGVLHCYIDGVEIASGPMTLDMDTDPATEVWLSCWHSNPQTSTTYFDELRVTKGRAVYKGNFTPPTEPLGAILSNKLSFASPPSEPTSGMAAWYDAADSVTITESAGLVSGWADKSGNGYDLSQPDPFYKPETSITSINGLNTLYFLGDVMATVSTGAGAVPVGASNYTMFVVFRSNNFDQSPLFMGAASSNNAIYLRTLPTALRHGWWPGTELDSPASSWTSSVPHMVSMGYNTTSRFVRIDQSQTSDTPTGKNTSSTYLWVGAFGTLSLFLDGDIGEIIIYHTALSASDLANTEAYLKNKWGL